MASFDDAAETAAAPQDVFKLLYDPGQFPRWWGCMQIEGNPAPSKHPDFGLPRVVSSSREGGRVTVSCALADIIFDWRLELLPQGARGSPSTSRCPTPTRLNSTARRQ